MMLQCRNELVTGQYSFLTVCHNRNPPKPVIGLTKYRAKLTLYRTYLQNFRSAHVSISVMKCLQAKITK